MRRDDRGAATPAVLAVAVLLLVVSGAVALVIAYAAAHHRARGVADLAAVSGAGAYASGEPCAVAGRVGRANRARVTTCEAVGDAVDHVVTVEAEVTVGRTFPGLPTSVRARASAGRLG
ncbi:Rv3654c family TadE-like protein [Mariniluteicoccus flavus]